MEIKKNLKIMFPFFFTYLFTCYAALKNSNFNYELINRDLFNNSRGNIIFDLNCTDKIINQFIFNVNVYDLENMDLLKSTDIVCAKNTGVINLPKKKLLLLLKSLNSNIRIKQKVFLYEIKVFYNLYIGKNRNYFRYYRNPRKECSSGIHRYFTCIFSNIIFEIADFYNLQST